jgi:hypothetical protein
MNTDHDRGALHNAVQHLVVLTIAARTQLTMAMSFTTDLSVGLATGAFYQMKGATEELAEVMHNEDDTPAKERWRAILTGVTAIRDVAIAGSENCCHIFSFDQDRKAIVAVIEAKLAMKSLDHVEAMARDLAELLGPDEVVALAA